MLDRLLDDPRAWLAARYAGWSWPEVADDGIAAPTHCLAAALPLLEGVVGGAD
jgi:hypothetical protein